MALGTRNDHLPDMLKDAEASDRSILDVSALRRDHLADI